GVPQQVLGRAFVVRVCRDHADAGVDPQSTTLHDDGFRQCPSNAADQGLDLAVVCHLGRHDGELVTSEPADQVALSYTVLQPFARDTQHLVADAVPQRVVDDLELVQVDEKHAHRASPI